VKGLFQFSKHNNIPIFASWGTRRAIIAKGLVYNQEQLLTVDELDFGRGIAELGLTITAFNTPHDSAESIGFTITGRNGYKVAYLTDLGEITPEVKNATLGADFAFVESNYEPELLRRNTKYPQFTKDRIKSRRGHLSNADSADYILELVKSGATKILLGHLSRENNTPLTAFSKTADKLAMAGLRYDCDYTLNIAEIQTKGKYIAV
jgi:phosphoribosyl 1,2-cyclic phosphodiesterase